MTELTSSPQPTPPVGPPRLPDAPAEELPAGVAAPTNALAALLKTPSSVIRRIHDAEKLPELTAQLFLWGLVFHALYGLAMGMFDSSGVALVAAGKAPLIAFLAVALCLPSLYVFSCVAGMAVTVMQALALAGSVLAMTGLLLLGLTPVCWLFSVSTSSLPFVVVVNFLVWALSLGFAVRLFRLVGDLDGRETAAGLKWWLAIYVIVSLQMTTTLRPMLVRSDAGWRATEKKFFLTHFRESLTSKPKPAETLPAPK